MPTLRTALIRLAYSHPEFRANLLPILKESGFRNDPLKVREGSVVVVRGAFGSGQPERVTVDEYSRNIKNGLPGIEYTTSSGEQRWCYMDQVDRVVTY